jgi:protein-tyrosine phosphatase
MTSCFVDIHCHVLPDIDDGPTSWDESLELARLAIDNGISTIVATPHQLGNFGHNRGDDIRRCVVKLQQRLDEAKLALKVLCGGEARIEPGLTHRILSGEVLTLGNHGRHVLIELPHELYLPLEPVLDDLSRHHIVGILAHPERNAGILSRPNVLAPLVERGCLLQVTAGSICGSFGPECQQLCEQLLSEGLVHFVATDAHRPRGRRPLMRPAFERVAELTDERTAIALCSSNPAAVAAGQNVAPIRCQSSSRRKRKWFTRKSAA